MLVQLDTSKKDRIVVEDGVERRLIKIEILAI